MVMVGKWETVTLVYNIIIEVLIFEKLNFGLWIWLIFLISLYVKNKVKVEDTCGKNKYS